MTSRRQLKHNGDDMVIPIISGGNNKKIRSSRRVTRYQNHNRGAADTAGNLI